MHKPLVIGIAAMLASAAVSAANRTIDATRARFPLAIVSGTTAADVDVSVRMRPLSGRVDYKVERGRRTDLPVTGAGRTYGKSVEVPANRWSSLRVVATGPRFEVWFNGAKLFEVEDATFTAAGRIGVWTKADSVTQFDDLTIVTR